MVSPPEPALTTRFWIVSAFETWTLSLALDWMSNEFGVPSSTIVTVAPPASVAVNVCVEPEAVVLDRLPVARHGAGVAAGRDVGDGAVGAPVERECVEAARAAVHAVGDRA